MIIRIFLGFYGLTSCDFYKYFKRIISIDICYLRKKIYKNKINKIFKSSKIFYGCDCALDENYFFR